MVKEADPLGMRMEALTCMQRLAPRDFKSSAVPGQCSVARTPPRAVRPSRWEIRRPRAQTGESPSSRLE